MSRVRIAEAMPTAALPKVAAACAPILIYFMDNPLFYPGLVMIVFLFYRHKANIKGLFEGTESKIGQKKASEDNPDNTKS